MWRGFIAHFVVYLIIFGFMFRLAGRKSWGLSLIIALAIALSFSVPRLVFGYYPDLDRGWLGYAVVAGITIAVCIPFSLLMALILKQRQKHDHDA
jgi:hypothetical protein